MLESDTLIVLKTSSPRPAGSEGPSGGATPGGGEKKEMNPDDPPNYIPNNPNNPNNFGLSKQALERRERYPGWEEDKEVSLESLSCRMKSINYINHMYFTLVLTFLVLLSMAFLFASLFGVETTPAITYIDLGIVAIFAVETITRCILIGPCAYFSDPLCVCDFGVTLIDLVVIALMYADLGADGNTESLSFIRVLRVCRLSKISRISRLIVSIDEEKNDERGLPIEKDDDGHIFAYNSATLFSLGWIYNLKGTVTAMPEIWVQALMLVITTTFLAALTCPIECDPYKNTYLSTCETKSCVNAIDPAYALMFLGLAAFLLGIFAQLLFDRWWNIRVLIEQLMHEVKNTTMMTMSFVRGNDKKSQQLRVDIVRWAKCGAYLLEKKIDGKKNYRSGVLKGYLTEEEWDKIEGEDNNYMMPQQWAFDALCQARLDNLVTEFGSTFDGLLCSFPAQRNNCSDILMLMDTPMPYIFIHLMTVICKVNLLFTAIACGTVVGQAVKTDQYLQILIGYIIVILGNMLIEGLLRLHVVLSDPFGDDACDFPWTMMMDDMDQQVAMMIDQQGKMRLNTIGKQNRLVNDDPSA